MKWFKTTLARIPTNFSQPFDVAVEARDLNHAQDRICRLYNGDIYSGIGCNRAERVFEVTDPDEIVNSRKHKLETL